MVRRFRVLGAVVLSSFVLAACSSDADPPPKYASVDAFCDAKASAECEKVSASCGVTAAACTSARKSECQKFVASAQTGTRTYQAKAAEGCVDKSREVFAKSPITPDDTKALAATCDPVFRGTQGKLQACTTAGDCANDFICDKGVCADRVEKKQGDFCGNPGEVCDASSYCTQGAAGSLQCAAKKNKTEGCDAKNPCQDSLRCQGGFCADRLGSGEPCGSDLDCGPSAPFCDVYNGNKCSAGIIAAGGTPVCKALFGG